MYALSPDSGKMDGNKIFREWFEHHFLECAPSGRPLLADLLLDGHSSHYYPTFIHCAARKK